MTVGCVERSWSVWAEDVQVQAGAAVCAGGPGRDRVASAVVNDRSKLYLRARKNRFKVENYTSQPMR